jgi:hypothetical protein
MNNYGAKDHHVLMTQGQQSIPKSNQTLSH